MKIQALTEAMRFVGRVRGKSEDNRHEDQNSSKKHRDENHPEGDDASKEQSFAEMTQKELNEKVDAAVGEFAKDEQAQANGLSASTVGNGPGLRVVLKGADGRVVRQFTGEEFMKLREATGKDHRTRGKILDQKL